MLRLWYFRDYARKLCWKFVEFSQKFDARFLNILVAKTGHCVRCEKLAVGDIVRRSLAAAGIDLNVLTTPARNVRLLLRPSASAGGRTRGGW